MKKYKDKNIAYWAKRAPEYSALSIRQLDLVTGSGYREIFLKEIGSRFPNKDKEDIKVLDIGVGPGFFTMILASEGYQVTGIDYTPQMLDFAKKNTLHMAGKVVLEVMDAQELTFPCASFDVIVSRNLTWDLPNPKQAYEEWIRVLNPGGLLLNFDANWYNYLFFDEDRKAYEADRESTTRENIYDEYVHTDIKAMEEIAREAPLSKERRPAWDIAYLKELGISDIRVDTKVWDKVWTREDKINYHATPMFMIAVVK